MPQCLLTYNAISQGCYSPDGLKKIDRNLKGLEIFDYTVDEQLLQAKKYATKLSIQGVQPKLSARLNVAKTRFDIVERKGNYILKPQHRDYAQLPENEDLSMKLAQMAGIDVPIHGLIRCKDESLTYFIKRFDRKGHGKVPIEDFAQLSGSTRDTKYNYSMEKLAKLIAQYCTFPMLENIKLFRRVIFNFLIGNEDMHLKNYSIITQDKKIELSPAYDFLNTSIVVEQVEDEIALPICGKRSRLKREDLIDYFGVEILDLPQSEVSRILKAVMDKRNDWERLIRRSFLSESMQVAYLDLLDARFQKLS